MFSIYADGVVPGIQEDDARPDPRGRRLPRRSSKINSGQSFGIGGVTPTLDVEREQRRHRGHGSSGSGQVRRRTRRTAMAGDPNGVRDADASWQNLAGLVVYWRVE